MSIWNDPAGGPLLPTAGQDCTEVADEPLSIFSERPAEGLVGPLVWCDHMDLLATMHVTPEEGRSVKVWRLLSDEKTPSCLFSYKGHSADWYPTAVAWSPRYGGTMKTFKWSGPYRIRSSSWPSATRGAILPWFYVEQKHTRTDTTMAVLRRAHSAKVAAMEWVLTPFSVDNHTAGIDRGGCPIGSWAHIRSIDDVRDANRRASEKADTTSFGLSGKWPSEVGYLISLSEDGHLSVHAEALAPVLSWTMVSSDLNTMAVLRTYSESNEQELVFIDTSLVLGSRGLAEYSGLVLRLQQLQRYIVDGINILLHGPLKSAAGAMKKLVAPLKAEMEKERDEGDDDDIRSITEELIHCFHGLGVPSQALSKALESPAYQTQALQKLQKELTEALDIFSVACAHQLEPAVDSLMASAHSIRVMAQKEEYTAILGYGNGGLEWAIDQLLTAAEHLTALLDEASSQMSFAIGCKTGLFEAGTHPELEAAGMALGVALPLITQLGRWQQMGEDLSEVDDVELDEKEKILEFVQAVYTSSTWRCGKNLDHLKDTIRLFGETAGGEWLLVFLEVGVLSRSNTCARVDENNKTIISQSVDALDSVVDARWGERHTLAAGSKVSEILRVCWTDSDEDPVEPDSHLFYVEVKRSRRKNKGPPHGQAQVPRARLGCHGIVQGNCEVLSKPPPVISRILPSSDYLWSTHTSTAPLRGLASVYENRYSKILTLDLEGGDCDDDTKEAASNPIVRLFS
ncbi:hypothetical protein FOZ60_013222 [Perkinsus olseni]|uniref:Anaphase-promoting complex subunit 4 n=1 Tax=Perkinsus olseni TaxID=32597 RepID=A0A7J6N9N7_PEROL|nr:hypothetical protein FOZ60_013222 [Perkinsus olseni]